MEKVFLGRGQILDKTVSFGVIEIFHTAFERFGFQLFLLGVAIDTSSNRILCRVRSSGGVLTMLPFSST